jgi:predicted alpha/beta hydrolase
MSPDTTSLGAAIAPLTLVTDDGFPLAATRYLAQGTRRGLALVAPATGVRMRFYRPFAEALASRGWDVLTWDWRGIGDSRHGVSWRDRRLTMRAWGERDLAAAIAWADRRDADAPVVLVGHSFGGQAVGLAPNAERLTAVALVAAQVGWYGLWPMPHRALLWGLWHVAMPIAAMVLGRFPSSRVGLGEDLPEHVAREWARWCRRPEALGDWGGHARLAVPVAGWSFADDLIAPRAAAEALTAKYEAATGPRHHHVAPAEHGVQTIGHFGCFRPGVVPGVWEEIFRFLEEVRGEG